MHISRCPSTFSLAAPGASSTAAPAPFMTVTTTAAAENDAEQQQLKLRNPDGVSAAAIQDGLDLYHSIMACEDPELKGALQEAMQVQQQRQLHAMSTCRLPVYEYMTCMLYAARYACMCGTICV